MCYLYFSGIDFDELNSLGSQFDTDYCTSEVREIKRRFNNINHNNSQISRSFRIVCSFFFQGNLDLKMKKKKDFFQPFGGVLSGCNQELHIWPPSMTDQNLLRAEIWFLLCMF